jgi:hypothetical protein
MKIETKLTLIKIIHTAVWIFFNFVIFYMLYAAIANKLDLWLWIGYGFVLLEGLTFLFAVLILMVNFQLDVSAFIEMHPGVPPEGVYFHSRRDTRQESSSNCATPNFKAGTARTYRILTHIFSHEISVQNALTASANCWLCSINAMCPPRFRVTSSA